MYQLFDGTSSQEKSGGETVDLDLVDLDLVPVKIGTPPLVESNYMYLMYMPVDLRSYMCVLDLDLVARALKSILARNKCLAGGTVESSL